MASHPVVPDEGTMPRTLVTATAIPPRVPPWRKRGRPDPAASSSATATS